jgi:CBS domain-containing protein
MSVGQICTRTISVARARDNVRDAAHRMVQDNISSLVVVDRERSPIGMVTDRDLLQRCVAEGLDPQTTRLDAVMSSPVVSVPEDAPIEGALGMMARGGIRHLAVINDGDELVGVLALDDLLELLSEEVAAIGRLLESRRGA